MIGSSPPDWRQNQAAYLTALALSPVVAGLIGAASVRAVFVADGIGLAVVAWSVSRMRSSGRSGALAGADPAR